MVHALTTWALVACWAALVPEPPAMQALRLQVAQEAERLKQQLTTLETGANYSRLLHRKLMVDCSLAPLMLQEDAAAFVAAVAAGREPPDLLRLLRVEYGPAPVRAEWLCEGGREHGAERIARALRPWALVGQASSAFLVNTCSAVSAPGESAPFIRWVCVARSDGEGRDTAAMPLWYEPCLDARDLDWPLSPSGIEVRWNAAEGTILAGEDVLHSESWSAAPAFNNPDDLYAVFDALRARNCEDYEVRSAPVATFGSAESGPAQSSIVRRLTREDGSAVRTETWIFEGERLAEWRMDQAPLRLVHRSPQAFEIKQQVEGEDSGQPQLLIPESVLMHPSGGLRCTIEFREADPSRDGVGAGAALPAHMRFECAGRTVASARILAVAVGQGSQGIDRVVGAAQKWRADSATSTAERLHDMSAAEAACASGDIVAIRAALERAGTRNQLDHVPESWNLANIATCVRRLEEHGHHAAAESLALEGWLPAVLALDSEERDSNARTALRHGSHALSYAVVGPLSQADGSVDAVVDQEWAASDEWAVERARLVGALPPCNAAALSTEHSALLGVIGRALAHIPDAEVRAALAGGACAALTRAQESGLQMRQFAAEHAEAQLTALVMHRVGELAPPASGTRASPVLAYARFRHRVSQALDESPPSSLERAQMHELNQTFALAARDVTLEELRRRGVPQMLAIPAANAALVETQGMEPLMGNPFAPALLHLPMHALPSPELARRAITSNAGLAPAMRGLDAEVAVRKACAIPFGRRAPDDGTDASDVVQPPDPTVRFAHQVSSAVVKAAWSALRNWYARE